MNAIGWFKGNKRKHLSKLDFRQGDVLLLLDSTWYDPHIWNGVEAAKAKGARVGVCVQDLIPTKCPQFCSPQQTDTFSEWLNRAFRFSDFFVTGSDAVVGDIRNLLSEAPDGFWATDRPVRLLKWGADPDVREDPAEVVRPETPLLMDRFISMPFYLMVGNIEPRKNQGYLLDAFNILWARGCDPNLVIVGRVGYQGEAIEKRIRRHRQWMKRLFMFNDLNDRELSLLYGKARALTFSSLAEGFGLPIVEALRQGLAVFASDIPVLRETGGDYCRYFNIADPSSLADMIETFEKGEALSRVVPPNQFAWPNWKESTTNIVRTLIELADSRQGCDEPASR